MTQRLFGLNQETNRVVRRPEGIRADCADIRGIKLSQALSKPTQRIDCPQPHVNRQLIVRVQTFGQSHRLPQLVDDSQRAVLKARNNHVKAVRSKVNRRHNPGR
jgi:hypothetical protein